jgi:hypothetical protein
VQDRSKQVQHGVGYEDCGRLNVRRLND